MSGTRPLLRFQLMIEQIISLALKKCLLVYWSFFCRIWLFGPKMSLFGFFGPSVRSVCIYHERALWSGARRLKCPCLTCSLVHLLSCSSRRSGIDRVGKGRHRWLDPRWRRAPPWRRASHQIHCGRVIRWRHDWLQAPELAV
jgi:hypothetical protein